MKANTVTDFTKLLWRNEKLRNICVPVKAKAHNLYKEKQGYSYVSPSVWSQELHVHKEVNTGPLGGEKKRILMTLFNSWQHSGPTPAPLLMGGTDAGGAFVQARRLWHFREKWNYESNLAEQRVCCVQVL